MFLCASNIYYKPNPYDNSCHILTVSMDSEMLGQGPFRIPRAAVRVSPESPEHITKLNEENSHLKNKIKEWRDTIGEVLGFETKPPPLWRNTPALPDPSAWR
jgi:hypothetical protein